MLELASPRAEHINPAPAAQEASFVLHLAGPRAVCKPSVAIQVAGSGASCPVTEAPTEHGWEAAAQAGSCTGEP